MRSNAIRYGSLAFLGLCLFGNFGWAQGDSASESPLLVEPQTPEELFKAAELLIDLARPELARGYLEQLLAGDPDDDTLLGIRAKHGPATLIRLANIEALQPESQEVLDRINAAFKRRANDPALIAALLDDLQGTSRKRRVALRQLRAAGDAAYPPLIKRWNDPSNATEAAFLVRTLSELGAPAVPALVATLDSSSEALKVVALETLAGVADESIAPQLWHAAHSPTQPRSVQQSGQLALRALTEADPSAFGLAEKLTTLARRLASGKETIATTPSGSVVLWTWMNTAETVQRLEIDPATARMFLALKTARQALDLAPDKPVTQAVYLAASLAYESHLTGDNRIPTGPGTAHDVALSVGVETIRNVVAVALEDNLELAAVAGLHVLGQIGNRYLVISDSPVHKALNASSRRVRMAAANTVLQLDPEKPFHGSRRVVDILRRALVDDGRAQVVVMDPDLQRANSIASFLDSKGYDGQVTRTGKQGFELATRRGDVELICVHANIAEWKLSQTLANLRADGRTSQLPVLIYAPTGTDRQLARSLEDDLFTGFAEESTTPELFLRTAAPFLNNFPPMLTSDERLQYRAAAAFWMAHIAGGRRTTVFDLTPAESALARHSNNNQLATNVLAALGAIPTASSQTHLAETCLANNAELPVRETGALELAFHIQRFGLLLKTEKVDQLRELHGATSDSNFKTALTAVLGSLEPNNKLVGERLRQAPMPPLPGSVKAN